MAQLILTTFLRHIVPTTLLLGLLATLMTTAAAGPRRGALAAINPSPVLLGSNLCRAGYHRHEINVPANGTVGGAPRVFHIYVPARAAFNLGRLGQGRPYNPVPVVYAFHGLTYGEGSVLDWAGVQALLTQYAEQANVIVVLPQGLEIPQPPGQPSGRLGWMAGDILHDLGPPASLYVESLHSHVHPTDTSAWHDDNLFMDALIPHIDAAPCTTTTRYVMGYSAGAGMAMAMACMRSTQFESAGAVAYGHFDSRCANSARQIPLIHVHNLHDAVIPEQLSSHAMHQYAWRNGCGRITLTFNDVWQPDRKYQFACPAGKQVTHYRLVMANPRLGAEGHQWPNAANSGTNATERIFQFFGLIP